MKITELDLKTEGKLYKCGKNIFKVKDGELVDTKRNTYLRKGNNTISDLLELDFEEINGPKTPYERVGKGGLYNSIGREGWISLIADEDNYDDRMFDIANYFNNRNYAQYIAFKETLMRKIDRFAWEHNAKVINWDRNVPNFYITFSIDDNKLIVDWNRVYKSNNIYFTSRKIAEKALEKFKDDLIKLYTWKFDV